MTTNAAPADQRWTWAPILLAPLSGSMLLADRVLEGTPQTVARVVLVAALIAAAAWCGSLFRGAPRGSGDPDLGNER